MRVRVIITIITDGGGISVLVRGVPRKRANNYVSLRWIETADRGRVNRNIKGAMRYDTYARRDFKSELSVILGVNLKSPTRARVISFTWAS